MVSFAKLHIIRQRIRKKYKNIGLENFLLSISIKIMQNTCNKMKKPNNNKKNVFLIRLFICKQILQNRGNYYHQLLNQLRFKFILVF
jgi:hypothetical protein